MKTDETITITTNDDVKAACNEKLLYVDYKNINKVVVPGNKIYIDDGLISLVVKEVSKLILNVKATMSNRYFYHQPLMEISLVKLKMEECWVRRKE